MHQMKGKEREGFTAKILVELQGNVHGGNRSLLAYSMKIALLSCPIHGKLQAMAS